MPEDPNRPDKRRVDSTTMTPAERRARAQLAVNTRWARVADRKAATRAAREARLAGYYAEADRQGVTDPELREAMARSAEQAEMCRLRAIQLRQARQAREVAAADQAGDAA